MAGDAGVVKARIEVDADDALRTVNELVARVRLLNCLITRVRATWFSLGFASGVVVGGLAALYAFLRA